MREYLRRKREATQPEEVQPATYSRKPGATVWTDRWSPPTPDIPALEQGRAFKVHCQNGHEYIGTSAIVACPAKGCGKTLTRK